MRCNSWQRLSHTFQLPPPPTTSPPAPVSRSRQTFDWYVQQLCKKNIKNSIRGAAGYAMSISIEIEIDLKSNWKLYEIIFVLFQQIAQESRIINDESVKCKSHRNILFCGFCWLFCKFRLFLCFLFGLTWILVRILRKSPRIKSDKKQAVKTQLAPAKQCELVSVSNLSEFSWVYFNIGSVDYQRRDVHNRGGRTTLRYRYYKKI